MISLLLILIATIFLAVVFIAYRRGSQEQATESDEEIEYPSSENKKENGIDVVIIGGGIVGCSLSFALAKDLKKRVLCIESDLSKPDRIIGELLQPGGVRKLKNLGLGAALEDIDSPHVTGYTVFMDGEQVKLTYPDVYGEGKPVGRSFHYGRFIMNLRKQAQSQPLVNMIQGTVTSLIEENGVIKGVKYVTKESEKEVVVNAPLTIIATGAGTSLTKSVASLKPKIASCFVGLQLKNAASKLPTPNNGHVFMAKQGPILCYPISSNTVRCLIDFPVDKIPKTQNGEMAAYLKSTVAPEFPEALRESFLAAIEHGDIRVAQNRELPPEQVNKKGVVVIGDAFNCRHPLTGGGMTVCFNDCITLRDSLKKVKDFSDTEKIQQALQRFYTERKKVSSTIGVLANALYAIFAARGDPMVPYMKQAVFEYFKVGGICASGPVGLLGGLIESPYVLVTHFFAVAVLFCARQNFPIPTPASIIRSGKLLMSATRIIAPFLVDENILRILFPPLLFQRS